MEENKPNVDHLDNREFPPLQKPSAQPGMVCSQHWMQNNSLTYNTLPLGQSSNLNNDLHELTMLMREINQIKNMCNNTSMLKAVKELKINLETCKTLLEKFQAFSNFAENFGNHG